MPWDAYRIWWGLAVLFSFLTAFFTPYQVAFTPGGVVPIDASDVIEYVFSGVFAVDMVVHCKLAKYNEGDEVLFGHRLIARNYLKGMFWIDFIAVFPFYPIALACAGLLGQDTQATRYLAILQLFRLVRLYRVKQLVYILQYSSKISLMWVIIFRNFGVALLWSHFNACAMFFIARQSRFDEESTWIGGVIADLTMRQQYVTSLYWSVVTFCTVGYGDYSPVNTAEQIWGVIYMLLNIIIASWIVGSMTSLIVKGDERTGRERDALAVLDQYSKLYKLDLLPENFHKNLKDQLKKEFYSRGVAGEQIMQTHFPNLVTEQSVNHQVLHTFRSYVHCKALRTMYVGLLQKTNFMKCLSVHNHQFIDAFLDACAVERFDQNASLECDSINSDLYMVIEGAVIKKARNAPQSPPLVAGDFINGIEFFTESPQPAKVWTVTICKMLTISKSAYQQIAEVYRDADDLIRDSIKRLNQEGIYDYARA